VRLLTRDDWQELRQAGISLVVAWALLRGAGWLVGWWLCGCTP
jgi:hypothetical protein